jgi:hypothetical protein
MRTLSKYAAAATLTGALALVAATPSQARWHGHWHGHNGAAAVIGFGAGALLGAAAASTANSAYYGPDYYGPNYYRPGYGGYAYEGYAYEPAPVYEAPQPRYYDYPSSGDNCWRSTARNFAVGKACD